ncbi:MAG: hypothetical protein GKR91_03500 [Pseudomonadales bacterium]|nr:hypothetical protein [Pseudomonadales bacterium]
MNSNELNLFYQKAGEAVWHLQYVEDFLAKLYVIKAVIIEPGSMEEEFAYKELEKVNRKTLGQLIGLAEAKAIVSPNLLKELKDFNDLRIWVVHRSNRESRYSLYTDTGRNEFLNKMSNFVSMSVKLQSSLKNELVVYGSRCGISEEEVTEIAEKNLSSLRGEI